MNKEHSHNSIENELIEFSYVEDLDANLADAFEDMPNIIAVHAEGLPVTAYTSGDTSGEPEKALPELPITALPKRITRRYTATNESDISHTSVQASPAFVNKSQDDSVLIGYPIYPILERRETSVRNLVSGDQDTSSIIRDSRIHSLKSSHGSVVPTAITAPMYQITGDVSTGDRKQFNVPVSELMRKLGVDVPKEMLISEEILKDETIKINTNKANSELSYSRLAPLVSIVPPTPSKKTEPVVPIQTQSIVDQKSQPPTTESPKIILQSSLFYGDGSTEINNDVTDDVKKNTDHPQHNIEINQGENEETTNKQQHSTNVSDYAIGIEKITKKFTDDLENHAQTQRTENYANVNIVNNSMANIGEDVISQINAVEYDVIDNAFNNIDIKITEQDFHKNNIRKTIEHEPEDIDVYSYSHVYTEAKLHQIPPTQISHSKPIANINNQGKLEEISEPIYESPENKLRAERIRFDSTSDNDMDMYKIIISRAESFVKKIISSELPPAIVKREVENQQKTISNNHSGGMFSKSQPFINKPNVSNVGDKISEAVLKNKIENELKETFSELMRKNNIVQIRKQKQMLEQFYSDFLNS